MKDNKFGFDELRWSLIPLPSVLIKSLLFHILYISVLTRFLYFFFLLPLAHYPFWYQSMDNGLERMNVCMRRKDIHWGAVVDLMKTAIFMNSVKFNSIRFY